MASPKSKISRSRRGSRRAHSAISAMSVQNCSNCGSIKRPHRVCPSCGYYAGREVQAPQL